MRDANRAVRLSPCLLVPVVLATLLPTVGWGQAVQTGKDAVSSGGERGRLGGTAMFSNDLGLGTFVTNDYSDDPYFGQSLRLVPTYGLFDKVVAQLDWTLAWEYTAPYAPDNTAGRHFTPYDVVLRITHSSLYRDERFTGINVSGAFTAALPTSHVSRFRDYVTVLTGTLGLDRTFLRRLTLAYAFGLTKYVTTTTQRGYVTDPDRVDEDAKRRGLVLCSESGDQCAGTPGINPNMRFRNEVSVGYRFTDRLSASMALRFTTFLKYKVGDGSTEGAEVNVEGMDLRHTQTWTLGDIGVSYQLTDRYSLSAGIVSEQLMADSRGTPRFPFFDFETPADNYTQFYLTGAATF